MSGNVRVEVTRTDHLAEFDQIFDELATAAMQAVTEAVVGEAGALSPVYNGFFKSSLAPDVQKPSPLIIEGLITSPLNYAGVIEGVDEQGNEVAQGRRSGAALPNFGQLREWVVKVLVPKIEGAASALLKQAGIRRPRRNKAQKVDDEKRREAAIDHLTWNVARAIAKRGLPREGNPKFRPIKQAALALDSLVNQILSEQLPADIAARL